MNNDKINQIDSRIQELNNLSNGRGRIIDGNVIAEQYLEEYNNLKALKDILNKNKERISGIPFISYDDVMIREDLLNEYHNLINNVQLNNVEYKFPDLNSNEEIENSDSIDNHEVDNLNSNINEETINNITPLEQKKKDALKRLEELNISKEFKKQYTQAINKTNDEQDIDIIMNAAENQNKSSNNSTQLIPGTKIPMPRAKGKDETIDEYEEYLKEHYRPYGYVDENIIYYPDTQIPIPRRPYPHETDYYNNDSYYNQMLNYMSNKYKAEKEKANPEYSGPVNENEQLAIIDENKELIPVDENKDLVPVDEKENIDSSINDGNEHEIKGIRKATEFLKRNKKKILIAAGITALALILGHTVIIPAIMHANSVLWHAYPAMRGFFAGCNQLLGPVIQATFNSSSGVWTNAFGGVINATAATDSLLAALSTSLLTTGAITVGVSRVIKAVKNKILNIKNKKQIEKINDEILNNNVENIENTNSNEKEEVNEINQENIDVNSVDETQNVETNDINDDESKKSYKQQIVDGLKKAKESIEKKFNPEDTMPKREDYIDDVSFNKAINEWHANNQAEQVVTEGGKTL